MSKIPVAKIKIKINGKGHSRQRKRKQDTNPVMGKGVQVSSGQEKVLWSVVVFMATFIFTFAMPWINQTMLGKVLFP